MDYYDVAQICRNGHIVTQSARHSPQHQRKFCETCGAPTIMACTQCSATIPGYYHMDNVIGGGMEGVPAFCGSCGEPFPWTGTALDEWHALSAMIDGLKPKDRASLDAVIDDLVRDTPRTARAVLALKVLAPKLGAETWAALRQILVTVATAEAKKALGL